MNREAHVKRIFSEDDVNRWVDVMRIDKFYVSAATEGNTAGQGKWVTIKWDDESEEGSGVSRTYEEITILPPDDPKGASIKLKVLKSLSFSMSGQKYIWSFKNASSNRARMYYRVRVLGRDDGEAFEQPISWEAYKKRFGSTELDDAQFVDVEFPASLSMNNGGQLAFHDFRNDEALDFVQATESPSDATMYRLDPFQVIVNVNWGASVDIMCLIDASGSNASFTDSYITNLARYLYSTFPGCRQGYANFIDFPYDPYGDSGDFVYRLFSALKTKEAQSYSGWSQYDGYGGDSPEAQLDAFYRCAGDPNVKWDRRVPKVILLFTDEIPHEGSPHTTRAAVVSRLTSLGIYPVYIGQVYSLGLGENIPTRYPTSRSIENTIRNGIAWWTENYKAQQ